LANQSGDGLRLILGFISGRRRWTAGRLVYQLLQAITLLAGQPSSRRTFLREFHGVVRSLIASKKVTIAAVHGNCLGGGADIAIKCDIVITSDDATWGFPEIRLGCFPPIAATALGALIGQKRASDLILTGATTLGTEAAEIGLATRAVTADNMDAAIKEAIEHLQKLSPVALAIAKKAIYSWDSIHFDKGLARSEKIYLEELMKTEDAREGIKAFLEKRNPMWQGR